MASIEPRLVIVSCGRGGGPVLLALIAAGIVCYGLFCFARARHLDR